MKYKANQNICYSWKYHIIWCPKYRRKLLIDGVDVRLEEMIQQTVSAKFAELIELEIMPDHVHLLIQVDPQYGVHRLVKQLKRVSSRKLRDEFTWLKSRIPTLWTNSYFVCTVGGAPLAVIKKYIENQKHA